MRTAALVALLALTGCEASSNDGPAEIKWDRDACKACGMVISERHFAAQVRGGPKNALAKFDDVGCALKWLDEQPWSSEPTTRVWVAHQDDGHWMDGKLAHYVAGKTSPMGFNFGAVEASAGGNDFGAQREAVRAFTRRKP